MAALVIACALGFGLVSEAQQQAPREHSMTGCLAKGADANTYKLTNVERVNNVDISESTANLAPHVGHKIEITGTAVPGKETHTMKITAVKMVAAACP
jgi:hypothetical protein